MTLLHIHYSNKGNFQKMTKANLHHDNEFKALFCLNIISQYPPMDYSSKVSYIQSAIQIADVM